jgi:hypothetical protein
MPLQYGYGQEVAIVAGGLTDTIHDGGGGNGGGAGCLGCMSSCWLRVHDASVC